MKKNISRRMWGWLMALLMLGTEIFGSGIRVYAEEDTAIEAAYEAEEDVVIEDSADEAEEVIAVADAEDPVVENVSEEAGDRDPVSLEPELKNAPTILVVNGVDMLDSHLAGKKVNRSGSVTTNDSGYMMYKNGALLLNGITLAKIAENSPDAVIICNGDLVINVVGDNILAILGRQDEKIMTGIRVDGNLTIQSIAAKAPSGKIDSLSLPGKLTIGIENSGSAFGKTKPQLLTEAKGRWIASIDCGGDISFLSPSGSSNNSGLTVECEGYPTESIMAVKEVCAGGNITVDGATVKVRGTNSSKANTKISGMYSAKDIDIVSGTVNVTSGIASNAGSGSVGIHCEDGTLTVGRYADVSAKNANAEDLGVGVMCKNALIAGVLKASGKTIGIQAIDMEDGIVLEDAYVAEPEDGSVYVASTYTSVKGTTGGNPSEDVLLHYGQKYDLWIGGTRIGDHNKNKLPNLSGTTTGSKFNPSSGTLTLKGVTGISGEYDTNHAKIYSKIPLNLRGDATIVSTTTNSRAIYAEDNLDIEGCFNLNATNAAILGFKNLRIGGIGTVINAEGGVHGIKLSPNVAGGEKLIIDDGVITVSGNSAEAIIAYDAGIELNGGEIYAEYIEDAPDDGTGAIASNVSLTKDSNMNILTPDGGVITKYDDGYWTITVDDNEADIVYIKSSIHNIAMTQANAVYDSELPDPVYEAEEGVTQTVRSYEGTMGNGEHYGPFEVKPSRVGEYTLTVDQKKAGETWHSEASFKITPKPVTAVVKVADREYNGEVNIEFSAKADDNYVNDVKAGDQVFPDLSNAKATVTKADVSENAAVKVTGVTLGGKDAYNYRLSAQPANVKVNITKATKTVEPFTLTVESGKAGNKDIKELIVEGAVCGDVEIKEGADQLTDAGAKVTDGVLSWETKAGLSEIKVVLSIPVTGAKNYKDYALEVTLFMECKDVQSVSLNLTEVTLDMGGSAELIAYITPDGASDKSVEWKSGDELVAIVNAAGVVTAVKKGTTEITVTTKDGGKTAKCKVTVTEKCVGDTDKITRISPEDVDAYVIPQQKSVSAETSKAVKLSNGESVKVSISINYTNAVTYTGKAIKPDEAPISAKVDTTDLIKKAGLEGKATEGLFKISFKAKKNKNASKKVDEASFYAVIKVNKSVQKSLGLDKKQKADLAKLVKAVNKALKASPCKFTINKASLADYAGSLELNVKGKDGKIKVKNGKLKNLKNVKYKAAPDATKLSTLSKSNYTAIEPDEATNSVKIKGKTNFTGSVRLEPKKQ